MRFLDSFIQKRVDLEEEIPNQDYELPNMEVEITDLDFVPPNLVENLFEQDHLLPSKEEATPHQDSLPPNLEEGLKEDSLPSSNEDNMGEHANFALSTPVYCSYCCECFLFKSYKHALC